MRRLLFLLLLLPLTAQAQIVPSGSLVDRGVPVQISTRTDTGVADTVIVTYRPNSSLARHVYLPTNGASEITWTPEYAGVVRLTAGAVQQNVSVQYQAPPLGSIIVLLIAGFILFGGAVYAFRKLFEA